MKDANNLMTSEGNSIVGGPNFTKIKKEHQTKDASLLEIVKERDIMGKRV